MQEKHTGAPPFLVKVLCVVLIVASVAFLVFFAPTIDHERSQAPRDANPPTSHPVVTADIAIVICAKPFRWSGVSQRVNGLASSVTT